MANVDNLGNRVIDYRKQGPGTPEKCDSPRRPGEMPDPILPATMASMGRTNNHGKHADS